MQRQRPPAGDRAALEGGTVVSAETRLAVKTRSRPRGYIDNYRPQAQTRALLADVDGVLDEYSDHWPLCARQIFYRLLGPRYAKTDAFYARLCEHVASARRGRWIPFDAIRDDGISTLSPEHFADEEEFYATVNAMARDYKRDKLAHQHCHVEVWCEAAGMIPQLARVAGSYSVPVYSCSGFDSLSAKYQLARRICDIGKPAVILHLGDFDPDGESIFTSIAEDVRAFVLEDRPWATVEVEFRRLALTEVQVGAYDLPTAPPKASSSRTKRWGDKQTCQLEALPPDVLALILKAEIELVLDMDQLAEDRLLEQVERRQIAYALPAPSRNGNEPTEAER